jgi:hypothetical protein
MFSKFRKLYAVPDLPAIMDPVFGRIFNEGWFWWGNTDFSQNARPIELIIPASGAGPEAWHRETYLQIQERYPSLRAQIIAAASKAVAEDLPQEILERYLLLPADDVQSSFQLESITLPEAENGSWEATYSSSITGQKYTVTIEAWAVTNIHHIR